MKLDVNFSALHKATEPLANVTPAVDSAISIYTSIPVSQLKDQPAKVQRDWYIGKELYTKKKNLKAL